MPERSANNCSGVAVVKKAQKAPLRHYRNYWRSGGLALCQKRYANIYTSGIAVLKVHGNGLRKCQQRGSLRTPALSVCISFTLPGIPILWFCTRKDTYNNAYRTIHPLSTKSSERLTNSPASRTSTQPSGLSLGGDPLTAVF